jgi:hypothetical protein
MGGLSEYLDLALWFVMQPTSLGQSLYRAPYKSLEISFSALLYRSWISPDLLIWQNMVILDIFAPSHSLTWLTLYITIQGKIYVTDKELTRPITHYSL